MKKAEIISRNPSLFESLDKLIAEFKLRVREHHDYIMCLHRYFSTECCEQS